jgi:hypothetical protein
MDKNKEQKEKFLEYYRQLPIQKLAADFIGVSENTITNWKKEDIEFCDQINSAKSQWALDNSKRVKSKEWLLERVMNEHFKERKEVEVIGDPLVVIKDGSKT